MLKLWVYKLIVNGGGLCLLERVSFPLFVFLE